MRTSEDKVCRKDLYWFVRAIYVLDKLPDVSGSGLREAGRYSAGQGCGHCARACGGSVRGHLGCAVGTGRTDVTKRGRSWLGVDRRGRRSLKG